MTRRKEMVMTRAIWHTLNASLRTRKGACAALLVLLAIAALIWHFAAPGNRTPVHRFVPGQRLVYRLEYLSASAADFSVLTRDAAKEPDQADNVGAKNDQAIFTTVEAELQATVVEVNTDGARI